LVSIEQSESCILFPSGKQENSNQRSIELPCQKEANFRSGSFKTGAL